MRGRDQQISPPLIVAQRIVISGLRTGYPQLNRSSLELKEKNGRLLVKVAISSKALLLSIEARQSDLEMYK